jgi:alpha-L-rhamnosidase
MIKKIIAISLIAICFFNNTNAQTPEWKKGILSDEFIFEKASFPASHAATIAETPAGLIVAWFGGTKEGYSDVEIRMSRLVDGKWTEPVSIADGISNDTFRVATYNPVLYQVPGGTIISIL